MRWRVEQKIHKDDPLAGTVGIMHQMSHDAIFALRRREAADREAGMNLPAITTMLDLPPVPINEKDHYFFAFQLAGSPKDSHTHTISQYYESDIPMVFFGKGALQRGVAVPAERRIDWQYPRIDFRAGHEEIIGQGEVQYLVNNHPMPLVAVFAAPFEVLQTGKNVRSTLFDSVYTPDSRSGESGLFRLPTSWSVKD